MKIEIYSRQTPPCPFCINAKKWLQAHNLPFIEYDITEGDNRVHLDSRLGSPAQTVPQIFIDDQLIGGYTDLIKSELAKSLVNRDLGGLSL